MKQKEKWAQGYMEIEITKKPSVQAAYCIKDWLAGFEFAKDQIIKSLYGENSDHYHTEVWIIEQVGEEEVKE